MKIILRQHAFKYKQFPLSANYPFRFCDLFERYIHVLVYMYINVAPTNPTERTT